MINFDEVSTFGIKPRFTAIELVFFSTPKSLIFIGQVFFNLLFWNRFITVHSHKWFNNWKNKYLICMAVGNCRSVLSRSENMFLLSYMPFKALILNGLLNEKAWKRIVKFTAKHVFVSSWQCAPIEKDYFWIKTPQASMVAMVDYYTLWVYRCCQANNWWNMRWCCAFTFHFVVNLSLIRFHVRRSRGHQICLRCYDQHVSRQWK